MSCESAVAETVETYELCRRSEPAPWTGHGYFCEPGRDREVRWFHAGLLPPIQERDR
jgi:hypothetical protein